VTAGNILLLRLPRAFDKLRDQRQAQQKIGKAGTAASKAKQQRPKEIKKEKEYSY